eukprot:1584586-Alexandrium_andersonii.AAC.1
MSNRSDAYGRIIKKVGLSSPPRIIIPNADHRGTAIQVCNVRNPIAPEMLPRAPDWAKGLLI